MTSLVGIEVTPVPAEVPMVGVIPEGVSAGGDGVLPGMSVVGVGAVVGSSDVGMVTGALGSTVGDGDPVVIPVGTRVVGRSIDVSTVGRVGLGTLGVGRRGVKSEIGAVPDGNVMVGIIGEVVIMVGTSLGKTSEVGIKVVVGAVGPVAGSVTPVVGEGRVGTAVVTSEIAEDTSDTTDETAEVTSDTAEEATEETSDTTDEATDETSETIEDTIDVTPGRSPVLSEVGITPESVVVGGTAAVVVGAVGAVSVPKAVVIPTTIPLEVSETRGGSDVKSPVPEGRIGGKIVRGLEGRRPLEASDGDTMVVGRPPVDPGTMNGPWNSVESPLVVGSPAEVVVG